MKTVLNSDFGIIFFIIMGIALLSMLYPMNRDRPLSRLITSLAPLPVLLWWLYEQMVPSDMNIRLDLLLIIPTIIFSLAVFATRIPWLLRHRQKSNKATGR